MATYRRMAVLADGLVRIARTDRDGCTDTALWSVVKLRKAFVCDASHRPLPVGTYAFRPVGNQMYRMCRLSIEAVGSMEAVDGR